MKINSLLLTSIVIVSITDSVAAVTSNEATAAKEGHLVSSAMKNKA
jgi:hypothetical protein